MLIQVVMKGVRCSGVRSLNVACAVGNATKKYGFVFWMLRF